MRPTFLALTAAAAVVVSAKPLPFPIECNGGFCFPESSFCYVTVRPKEPNQDYRRVGNCVDEEATCIGRVDEVKELYHDGSSAKCYKRGQAKPVHST